MKNREAYILDFLAQHPLSTSKEVHEGIELKVGLATIKRDLNKLSLKDFVKITGKGRATKYSLGVTYSIAKPIVLDQYFEQDIDERKIKTQFDLDLIPKVLHEVVLFTDDELEKMEALQKSFENKIASLTEGQYQKEFERLAIDLSWKSSQIEGNTYSLLETERLLTRKETAAGKHRNEATMLLNHKDAIDFIVEHPDYINFVEIRSIEDIHSLLTKELDIDRNIRNRSVGITGTNYKPLDNEFQIREALQHTCNLVNSKEHVFEKAFLLLILLSYIQPFNDGNKRTARIVCNAALINSNYCPMSFRTIDSIEYKKAMLVFYEQNNISIFKQIFMEQFEFAVNTYF